MAHACICAFYTGRAGPARMQACMHAKDAVEPDSQDVEVIAMGYSWDSSEGLLVENAVQKLQVCLQAGHACM